MSSQPLQRRASAPAPKWLEALRAGTTAAREALARLFSPFAVELATREDWLVSLIGAPTGPATRQLEAAFTVDGPVRAQLFFLAGEGDDQRLTSALLRRPPSSDCALGPEDREAFSELANIIASSFLNGLARDLKLRLLPSVPAVEESTLVDVRHSLHSPDVWAIAAYFTVALPSGSASGVFVAVPDPDSFGT